MSDYVRRLRRAVGSEPLLLPSVTVLILDEQQRLLLVRINNSQLWVAPGGSIDPGERPADAAVREAWEETGLKVRLTGLAGVFGGPDFRVSYPNGDVVDYIMTVFFASAEGGNLQPRDSEVAESRYFSRNELTDLELPRWAIILFPQIFSGTGRADCLDSSWCPPEA
ncbi:MAG: NUDIX domain-containing protein [Acidobacteria bacterium]|nr:NUDIX domain-containing protein [Acidobacteriota bacterium]MCI0718702.1 NUDIX domain-containing protein [Acidobacteriota bacterium]